VVGRLLTLNTAFGEVPTARMPPLAPAASTVFSWLEIYP